MATYMELFSIKNNSDLQDKVTVAVAIAAETIRTDSSPPANQTQRLVWAQNALAHPVEEAQRMLWVVLAANKDSTLAQIVGVSDTLIQEQVDDTIDLFAGS